MCSLFYIVLEVVLFHPYFCIHVQHILYCSGGCPIPPLFLYTCVACFILFWRLSYSTLIFVYMCSLFYIVLEVVLFHPYFCIHVQLVLYCSGGCPFPPLFLYACVACFILFWRLSFSTFISVYMCSLVYIVLEVVLFHPYFCIHVQLVLYCSGGCPIPPLFLYTCEACFILFWRLSYSTFISVCMCSLFYIVLEVVLFHPYFCIHVQLVLYCSGGCPIPPLFLYTCVACFILFWRLSYSTLISVYMCCLFYIVLEVVLFHPYFCIHVQLGLYCSGGCPIPPLFLYTCVACFILFWRLSYSTLIYVYMCSLFYIVLEIVLFHPYFCIHMQLVLYCSGNCPIPPLFLYTCAACFILFWRLSQSTLISVYMCSLFYIVLEVVLFHPYLCIHVQLVLYCSGGCPIPPLFLYTCVACFILFWRLSYSTLMYVYMCSLFYIVLEVVLFHLYFCIHVQLVLYCSGGCSIPPLFLYTCVACLILFWRLSYSTLISVYMCSLFYIFLEVVLFHLYFCIHVQLVLYFSGGCPIPPLFLYTCVACFILFWRLSYSTFISVYMCSLFYIVLEVVLFHPYFCIHVQLVLYCSGGCPIPPLFLYTCVACFILFWRLSYSTLISVYMCCLFYIVLEVVLFHPYFCIHVQLGLYCSGGCPIPPLFLYTCVACFILFWRLSYSTLIYVYMCSLFYIVLEIVLFHPYFCIHVQLVLYCSGNCPIPPLFLYTCAACFILFWRLSQSTLISVYMCSLFYIVLEVVLFHPYLCIHVQLVLYCSGGCPIPPLFLYTCVACFILFWRLSYSTLMYVYMCSLFYIVLEVVLFHLYFCIHVQLVLYCSGGCSIPPLFLYTCVACLILFWRLSYSTLIYVYMCSLFHIVLEVVLFHPYFCIHVQLVLYFSGGCPIPPLFLYTCVACFILFWRLSYSTFISVYMCSLFYIVLEVVLFHPYFCIHVQHVLYCSGGCPIPPLFLYTCAACFILFWRLSYSTIISVYMCSLFYIVLEVVLFHPYFCIHV